MQFKINAPRIVHETIDGETVIIDSESGLYFNIEGSGVDLWQALAVGTRTSELITLFSQRYPEHASELPMLINQFVDELQQAQLITPSTDPSGSWSWSENSTSFQYPRLNQYTDMQELLLLDPIHEVDEQGWPLQPKA